MSYIGSTPTTQSFIAGTDYFNGNGSTVNFTLSRSVNSVNDIEVIVNNVEQIPSGYSVSGTTLTFSAAPSAGTSNVYVRYLSTTNLSLAIPAGTSATFNTVGVTGNLNFTGTGNRITGDFSNATIANRVAFQTSTVNGATQVRAIPNGTGTTATMQVGNNSDPSNQSVLSIGANATEATINSFINGTGTYLPMTFYTGGSERVKIDTSGNVGIGTSSPNYKFNVGPTSGVLSLAGAGVSLFTTGSLTSNIGGVLNFRPGLGQTASDIFNLSICAYDHSGDTNADGLSINAFDGISFCTGSNSRQERARIDSSGNLLVGTTTAYGLVTSAKSSGYCFATNSVSNGADHILFTNTGTTVGSITRVGGTGVIYNTTSDYRAKEDITPMTGALVRNALLNPVKYKWKVDGSEGEGFIAHQLQGSFPNAVTGEKDAVDADGNPVYQGIGTGPLDGHFAACVNELQAIIQEQQSLITALTTRITALENNNATQ
jgi:hypothetical protein